MLKRSITEGPEQYLCVQKSSIVRKVACVLLAPVGYVLLERYMPKVRHGRRSDIHSLRVRMLGQRTAVTYIRVDIDASQFNVDINKVGKQNPRQQRLYD
jgi:hypothetical protein